ncbi:MAG: hypothetical protein MJK08_09400 [Campylobacterales bacterium]|nr:hypothetical protein [Campylobacterales bacterium]NQY52613.1 hypothetical protein [Campylobacteraceae bacterium]
MTGTIINILVFMTISSAIAFYLGYMFGTTKAYTKKVKLNPIFKNQCNIYHKPLIMSLPKRAGKDNLTEVKGINEALENELNKLGIFHFEQISKWTNKNLEWVEVFLGIEKQISDEKWISQASSLYSKSLKK